MPPPPSPNFNPISTLFKFSHAQRRQFLRDDLFGSVGPAGLIYLGAAVTTALQSAEEKGQHVEEKGITSISIITSSRETESGSDPKDFLLYLLGDSIF